MHRDWQWHSIGSPPTKIPPPKHTRSKKCNQFQGTWIKNLLQAKALKPHTLKVCDVVSDRHQIWSRCLVLFPASEPATASHLSFCTCRQKIRPSVPGRRCLSSMEAKLIGRKLVKVKAEKAGLRSQLVTTEGQLVRRQGSGGSTLADQNTKNKTPCHRCLHVGLCSGGEIRKQLLNLGLAFVGG